MRTSGTGHQGAGRDDEFAAAPEHYDSRAYDRRQYDNRQYDNRQYDRRQYDSRQYDNREYGRAGHSGHSGHSGQPRRASLPVRAGRVVSGVVAGAVLVLAAVVVGAQYLGGQRGFPGPGSASVAAHVVAALVAVGAQIVADRARGFAAFAAPVVTMFHPARPPLRWSSVGTCLARNTGSRIGSTRIPVPSRTMDVLATMAASIISGSK